MPLPFGAAGWALWGERRRQNPEVRKEEGMIFGQKSGLLDSVSYKRTIDWFSFFCAQWSSFSTSLEANPCHGSLIRSQH